ncbi:MAG: T9SS type A sorting domain-containing protein, partial [Bacteroidota bacterium]
MEEMTGYMKNDMQDAHLLTASFAQYHFYMQKPGLSPTIGSYDSRSPYHIFDLDDLDIVSLHNYSISEWCNRTRHETTKRHMDDQESPNFPHYDKKPIHFNETGGNDDIERSTDWNYHNVIWSSAMMGQMGTGLVWYGIESHQNGNHHNLRPLAEFFETEDLFAYDYDYILNMSRDITPNPPGAIDGWLENYAMVDEDHERALGWVHNRTYYPQNQTSPAAVRDLFEIGDGSPKGNCKYLTKPQGDYPDFSPPYGSNYANANPCDPGPGPYTNYAADRDPLVWRPGQWIDLGSGWDGDFQIEWFETNGVVLTLHSTQSVTASPIYEFSILTPPTTTANPDFAYKITKTSMKKADSEKAAPQHEMLIFPNPTQDMANIFIMTDREVAARIELFDISGKKLQLIHAGTMLAQQKYSFRIETCDLSEGMYLVK